MTSRTPRPAARLGSGCSRGSPGREARHLADVLRTETVGGALLLLGAVAALAWANSPWSDSYTGSALGALARRRVGCTST